MQIPALPHTEQERLLALKLTGLLDTESEPTGQDNCRQPVILIIAEQ